MHSPELSRPESTARGRDTTSATAWVRSAIFDCAPFAPSPRVASPPAESDLVLGAARPSTYTHRAAPTSSRPRSARSKIPAGARKFFYDSVSGCCALRIQAAARPAPRARLCGPGPVLEAALQHGMNAANRSPKSVSACVAVLGFSQRHAALTTRSTVRLVFLERIKIDTGRVGATISARSNASCCP